MTIMRVNKASTFIIILGLTGVLALTLTLPGLHERITPRRGHYEGKRIGRAYQARAIIQNSGSDCKNYECESSPNRLLRICRGTLDGAVVDAYQWCYYAAGGWREGTAFVQRRIRKTLNYLRNNQCREVVQ